MFQKKRLRCFSITLDVAVVIYSLKIVLILEFNKGNMKYLVSEELSCLAADFSHYQGSSHYNIGEFLIKD